MLRAHLIMPEGALRDTAVYAITREGWPGVETGLRARIGA